MDRIAGKKIAIMATVRAGGIDGPKKALEQAGAKTEVISPHGGEIEGWKSTEWGDKVKVDREVKAFNLAIIEQFSGAEMMAGRHG